MKDLSIRFIEKINDQSAVIGVIGLGYVGLPLALLFAEKGYHILGFDTDPKKIDHIGRGISYIKHIPSESIKQCFSDGFLRGTGDFSRIGECDACIICVPTPLDTHRQPDLSYLRSTAVTIAPHVKSGIVVSLESTTYPGTTDELLIPLLETGSGLSAGKDFMVCFSPEREDPNNKRYSTKTIPKVVGGVDKQSLEAGVALYGAVVDRIVPVSSTKAAEATKLMENIFRSVNIALVNEMKVILQAMDIDIWEVIEAAKTKPFGYMPFYPGPGLGGHCIPIDPFYLSWKAKEFEIPARFIELAGEINTGIPHFVINRTMDALDRIGKTTTGSRILIMGMAYKPDIDDIRESPSLKLFDILKSKGAIVDFHDPYVMQIPSSRHYGHLAGIRSVSLDDISSYDALVISTNHSTIDYEDIVKRAALIIDTRNACPNAPNVVRA